MVAPPLLSHSPASPPASELPSWAKIANKTREFPYWEHMTRAKSGQLFSPTSSLPAFPSLLPLSSYHRFQTYPTLATTLLQVQQVVLVLRRFTVDIAYGGALSDAVELGLPDGLSLVFTRAVFETCLSHNGSNADLQGRRHAHVRRAHPHSRERITRAPVSSRAAQHHPPPSEPAGTRRYPGRSSSPSQSLRAPAPPTSASTSATTIPSREFDITYFPNYTALTYPQAAPSRAPSS
ncbi:hypothetical protein B0H11DRAFT_2433023 [Mycena galericulata]|nr:hypothetical protein B0H11DRAFT_2433023 [Mycena galericulata]